ncbi:MAG: hypothetical protein ABR991_12200 [Terracidiphilus sp.]|jgi:hypothetical protein
MRKLMFFGIGAVLVIQAAVICAQSPQKSEPQLALAISEWHGELGPRFDRVRVIVTNTSKDVFYEPGCSDMRDIYHVSVSYNGTLLEEKDAAARHRGEAEQAAFCTHELGINPIISGGSFQLWFDLADRYDLLKPGTYEVTVSRETDPDHPEKSVTVKSNTLTVIVPEPPIKLTLSENHDLGAGLDRVNVTETNISDKDFIDQDHGCIRELGWFTVEVFYNGDQLEEKDIEARFRREDETLNLEIQHKAPCATEPGDIVLKPGKSRKLWLGVSDIYDVTKPGSYEIYVSRETNPIGHIKSTYVRSNTITIIVP